MIHERIFGLRGSSSSSWADLFSDQELVVIYLVGIGLLSHGLEEEEEEEA